MKTLLILMLAGCWGATEAAAQSHPLTPLLPTNASLSRLKLTRMWWGSATMNATRDKLVFMTLDDTHLYAHSSSGILNCFDAETGRKLWVTNLGGQDEPAFPPATNESFLLMASGSVLYCLNKFNGDMIWQFSLPVSPSTPPIMDDTQLYIATADGSLMAFDLQTLFKFYNKRIPFSSNSMAVKWKYKISSQILTLPVEDNHLVSFHGTNRTTYTISRGRDLKYTFDTPVPASAPLATDKGVLYICSGDARLFAINQLTGAIRWQTVVGSPVERTPRIIGDDLFATPAGVGMFRFRASDGREQWNSPARGVDEFLGASVEAVYGGDRAMNLIRLSRATGQVQGRLPLDRFPVRISNELTDRVYMATSTGLIIALREQGRELPLYFKHPDRLPIMPEFAPDEPEAKPEGATDGETEKTDKPAEEKTTEEKSTEEKPAGEKPEGETSN